MKKRTAAKIDLCMLQTGTLKQERDKAAPADRRPKTGSFSKEKNRLHKRKKRVLEKL